MSLPRPWPGPGPAANPAPCAGRKLSVSALAGPRSSSRQRTAQTPLKARRCRPDVRCGPSPDHCFAFRLGPGPHRMSNHDWCPGTLGQGRSAYSTTVRALVRPTDFA